MSHAGKTAIFFLIAVLAATPAFAAKKKAKRRVHVSPPMNELTIVIPDEAVAHMKDGDVSKAANDLRMEATSPQSKYLLKELERIKAFEGRKEKCAKNDHHCLFNIGTAYHNIYLFLKSRNISAKKYYRKAHSLYSRASGTKSSTRKNNVNITRAALYASGGEPEKAEGLFEKCSKDEFGDEHQKYMTLAFYYSSIGNAAEAVNDLEQAMKLNEDFTKFWLGVSFDYDNISASPEYSDFVMKHGIERLDRGMSPYSVK